MSKNLAAIRRVQVASRNNLRNKNYKSSIKTISRKILCQIHARESLNLNEVNLLVAQFYSKIDKAVKKGIIHRNSAARKKSILAQKLKNVTSG